ncbi:MAG TPA: DUF2207 domain-containing protein [Patescibacteria group bacterium]|nr:DUF2207 domain-containing protein [Patescibacteria group bacterium]
MKKACVIILFFLITAGPALAQSSVSDTFLQDEIINDYQVIIEVNQDASIDVMETIYYDFGGVERHGIYRSFPIKYQARGGNYNLRVSDVEVTNNDGHQYNFEISYPESNVEIKIGDPNSYVIGEQVYIISYKIRRAINYFDDHDELYWNAIGDQWQVPITKASVLVFLPEKIQESELQRDCFVGTYGSTGSCRSNYIIEADGVNKINFLSADDESFLSGEGMTIVVGWPKGLVYQPTWHQQLLEIIKDNWILALPVVVLIMMIFIWQQKGRDPKGQGTIVTQFDAPNNLTPAQVGTIIDERVDNRDVSAEIIELAVSGYIKIIRTEEKQLIGKKVDYTIEKLKEPDDKLKDFQFRLIKMFFSDSSQTVKLSTFKNKLSDEVKLMNKEIYNSLVDGGYFSKNPVTVKGIYMAVASIIIFFDIVLFNFDDSILFFSILTSGIIIFIFSFLMPVKTKQGVEAKEHILGLKSYLSVAENDRLKFHNAPEKNPEQFEKLLPYAMVLKVEKQWAKQFENIYHGQPKWYSDSAYGSFTPIFLVSNLNNFRSVANTSFTPKSSAGSGGSGFGGGGFSSGGFGGGGGGSW